MKAEFGIIFYAFFSSILLGVVGLITNIQMFFYGSFMQLGIGVWESLYYIGELIKGGKK